ncbi:MAG: hypothetical protein ACKPKO_09940, partial [Candidatus Fonsibacter sp.]
MLKNKNILIVGNSGSRFYSPNGKKSSPLTATLMEHSGFPNMYDLTEVGVHPRTWVQLLQKWKMNHQRLALPTIRPDESVSSEDLQFGSDFVVIGIDAQNGLQLH